MKSLRPRYEVWPLVQEIEVKHLCGINLYSLFDDESARIEVITEKGHDGENLIWYPFQQKGRVTVRVGSYDFEKGGLQVSTWYGFIEFAINKIVKKDGEVLNSVEGIMGFVDGIFNGEYR